MFGPLGNRLSMPDNGSRKFDDPIPLPRGRQLATLALRRANSAPRWRAVELGWLWRHESGTYVKFTPAGAELLA
jgi:hypothetical protein